MELMDSVVIGVNVNGGHGDVASLPDWSKIWYEWK